MLKRIFDSFSFAWNGLRTTWREEQNFKIEVVGATLVIFFIFYFRFSFVESALCIMAITIVLSAEIINTALEDLCDKIESRHDPIIGKVKDTTGAFVLISVLGATIVGALVFYHHLFYNI